LWHIDNGRALSVRGNICDLTIIGGESAISNVGYVSIESKGWILFFDCDNVLSIDDDDEAEAD
jgi:hypothetical protein